MTDELRTHWELHLLDEEAVRLEGERAQIPGERQQHERRVAAARSAVQRLDARSEAAQKKRRELERDIAALDAQVRHFEHQLASVTDQRQFEAVQHEIAAVKSKRDAQETEALEQLETEEAAAAERPALADELGRCERDAAEAGGALDAREARLTARLTELDAARDRAAAALAPAARTRYERLRTGRSGRAIAAMSGSACGTCQSTQPPHALQEVRKREALLLCEGCGRLLLLAPEDPAA